MSSNPSYDNSLDYLSIPEVVAHLFAQLLPVDLENPPRVVFSAIAHRLMVHGIEATVAQASFFPKPSVGTVQDALGFLIQQNAVGPTGALGWKDICCAQTGLADVEIVTVQIGDMSKSLLPTEERQLEQLLVEWDRRAIDRATPTAPRACRGALRL